MFKLFGKSATSKAPATEQPSPPVTPTKPSHTAADTEEDKEEASVFTPTRKVPDTVMTNKKNNKRKAEGPAEGPAKGKAEGSAKGKAEGSADADAEVGTEAEAIVSDDEEEEEEEEEDEGEEEEEEAENSSKKARTEAAEKPKAAARKKPVKLKTRMTTTFTKKVGGAQAQKARLVNKTVVIPTPPAMHNMSMKDCVDKLRIGLMYVHRANPEMMRTVKTCDPKTLSKHYQEMVRGAMGNQATNRLFRQAQPKEQGTLKVCAGSRDQLRIITQALINDFLLSSYSVAHSSKNRSLQASMMRQFLSKQRPIFYKNQASFRPEDETKHRVIASRTTKKK
jgi:hypothetical protein